MFSWAAHVILTLNVNFLYIKQDDHMYALQCWSMVLLKPDQVCVETIAIALAQKFVVKQRMGGEGVWIHYQKCQQVSYLIEVPENNFFYL